MGKFCLLPVDSRFPRESLVSPMRWWGSIAPFQNISYLCLECKFRPNVDIIDSSHTITSVVTEVNVLAPSREGACSLERIVTTFEEDLPASFFEDKLNT